MKYLLDTNICIYIINEKPEGVLNRFRIMDERVSVCISSITVAELFYGIEKSDSAKKEQNRNALLRFLASLEIQYFDERAAMEYGVIRSKLERKCERIGAYDMLIAAQARSCNTVLVTNNVREFRRIPDLEIENWAEGSQGSGNRE